MKQMLYVIVILLLVVPVFGGNLVAVYVKPLVGGVTHPSTTFNYEFNFTTAADCSEVLLSVERNITTDADGVGFANLTITNLNHPPNFLCEYRDGALRKVHTIGTSIASDALIAGDINVTGNVTLSGNVTANYGFFNYLGSLADRIIELFVTNIDTTNLHVESNASFSGDINITGDLNVTGNATFSGPFETGCLHCDDGNTYFHGDGFFEGNVTAPNIEVMESLIVHGNSTCTGAVTACNLIVNPALCGWTTWTGQRGCRWRFLAGDCYGTATACVNMSTATCEEQHVCTLTTGSAGFILDGTGLSGNFSIETIGNVSASHFFGAWNGSVDYVPYSGATTNVDLNGYNITASNFLGSFNFSAGTLFDGWFTPGSVIFANASGNLAENNTQFFWDNANAFLGVGTNTPRAPLEILSNATGQFSSGFWITRPATTNIFRLQHYFPGITYFAQNIYRHAGGNWFMDDTAAEASAIIVEGRVGGGGVNILSMPATVGDVEVAAYSLISARSTGRVGIRAQLPAYPFHVNLSSVFTHPANFQENVTLNQSMNATGDYEGENVVVRGELFTDRVTLREADDTMMFYPTEANGNFRMSVMPIGTGESMISAYGTDFRTDSNNYEYVGFIGGMSSEEAPVVDDHYIVSASGGTGTTRDLHVGTWKEQQGKWYSISWSRCKDIDILNPGPELANFPVFINVTYDSDMQADYDDVIFVNDTCANHGSLLAFELEDYTDQQARYWVNIDKFTTTKRTISMYYGNPGAASAENSTGVWNAEYYGVYHFNSSQLDGDAPDSTAGNRDLLDAGSPVYEIGTVGQGIHLDGLNDMFSDTWSITGNWTVESWINLSSLTPTLQYLISPGAKGLLLAYTADKWGYYDGAASQLTDHVNVIDQWIHVTVTKNNSNGYLMYHNGEYAAHLAGVDNDLTTMYFGSRGGTWWTNGTADEFRGSSIDRTPHWINMTYQIVANQSVFVVFGAEESMGETVSRTVTFESNGDVTIYNNLNQTDDGGNASLNNFYGEMWFHNHTTSVVNFAVEDVFYNMTMANHLMNGFRNETRDTMNVEVAGLYLVNYYAVGSGQNNHEYVATVGIDGVVQTKTSVHKKMAAGGDYVIMSGTGLLRLEVDDVITLMVADFSGTGTGHYLGSNINLVRIGN